MRYLSLIIICLFSFTAFAQQNKEFDRANFIGKEKEFKIANKEYKKGNKHFKKGKGMYSEALKHYEVAYKFNPNSALLNYKMGICLLEGMYDTTALEYLKKGIKLNEKVYKSGIIRQMERDGKGVFHYQYLLGRAYHINKKWDEAINAFNAYKQSLSRYDLKYFGPEVDKQIKECNAGKKLIKSEDRVRIQNVGNKVNSTLSDYGSFLANGDSTLFFTSRRTGDKGQARNQLSKLDNQYFEKVYMATFKDDEWVDAKAYPKPVNKHKRHQATAGVSNDGKTLYLYITKSRMKGGNIYYSEYKKGKWRKPKKFKKIDSKYDETSIAFSKDNKYMFFVSNRPHRKAQGGRDIWYCVAKKQKKNGKIKWSRPKNLGENINTPYDEDYPFMHHDNQTFYFSSKGHNSMGGYDIFKASLIEEGVFQRPTNMSAPINTPRDDIGFALREDERLAYYTSSNSKIGTGEKDIFVIKYLGKEKEVILDFETHDMFSNIEVEKQIEPEVEAPVDEVVVIEGKILGDKSYEPISAEILIVDPDTKRILARFDNHSVTGEYKVTVNPNAKYKIKVKSIGYANGIKMVEVGDFQDQDNYTVNLTLSAESEKETTTILILDKLYFEYKSSVLMEESYPQLNRVARLMMENPKWEVEVGGHTDNIGSPEYNVNLSGDRAKAVVDYLVSRGVPLKRLWWKGYGDKKPISTNAHERGRAKNRRVEFKILKR